jgi:hypothetical protein
METGKAIGNRGNIALHRDIQDAPVPLILTGKFPEHERPSAAYRDFCGVVPTNG